MLKRLLRKVYSALVSIKFIAKNLRQAFLLDNIVEKKMGDLWVRGMTRKDERQVLELYKLINNGKELAWTQKWLYKIVGRRLVFIALDEKFLAQGLNLYYFNSRDIDESTIHEGFVGVHPDSRGRGIATVIRQHAISNFAKSKLLGISSRISLSNKASLKSAVQLGFKPVTKYYDSALNEDRYYLLCNFSDDSISKEVLTKTDMRINCS